MRRRIVAAIAAISMLMLGCGQQAQERPNVHHVVWTTEGHDSAIKAEYNGMVVLDLVREVGTTAEGVHFIDGDGFCILFRDCTVEKLEGAVAWLRTSENDLIGVKWDREESDLTVLWE